MIYSLLCLMITTLVAIYFKILENDDVTSEPRIAMALSHKDCKLPNSRIWLAEIDMDRHLVMFCSEDVAT